MTTIVRFEPLTTDRLLIRPMDPGDVDALHKRRNDPSTAALQSWALPYPRESAQALVDTMVALDGVPPDDGWLQLSVEDRESGELVGDLALHLTFGGRSAEVGYTLSPEARGKGFATEAVGSLINWIVTELGASRVSAMMHPDNHASIRVAERLGLVFEGRTVNSYWVGDEVTDDVLYGMTPQMWESWRDRNRSKPARVNLAEVTFENVAAIGAVTTHGSQTALVAPVTAWFSDIVAPPVEVGRALQPWLRAVIADGDVVGALLMSIPDDVHHEPYIWRLLVDRMHQGRGIGRQVLDLAVDQARSWDAATLKISWVDAAGTAGPLYLNYGFVPTGEIHGGEIVAGFQL